MMNLNEIFRDIMATSPFSVVLNVNGVEVNAKEMIPKSPMLDVEDYSPSYLISTHEAESSGIQYGTEFNNSSDEKRYSVKGILESGTGQTLLVVERVI